MTAGKTNAAVQAAYRERMKAKGFKQTLVWTNYLGHLAVSADSSNEPLEMPQLNASQFAGRLKKAFAGFSDTDPDADIMRAAVADYADRLRHRFDVIDREVTKTANDMEAAKNGATVDHETQEQQSILRKMYTMLTKKS